MKSKVYYSKTIDANKLIEMYKLLGKELTGNIAVKVHSGEDGNQNFLHPEFWKPIIDYVKGTVVECNTAYGERFGDGKRDFTEDHLKVIERHGWNKYFNVDIMDKDSDIEIDVPNGKYLKKDILGKGIEKYDSMLVLSHFKGHPMGGFGGALKQLSIGFASSEGKSLIHSAGTNTDQYTLWDNLPAQDAFLESMAEAASAVVKYFNGNMVFVNIMANMSVDCDCCSVAEDPCMKDMGMLISLDPIAIDQACIDIVLKSNDPGKEHFMERVNSRNGIHTIERASELEFGSREYELIEI